MQSFICITCGVGHAQSEVPPSRCPICEDERIREQEPGLYGIGAIPQIAIGQRALYIQQPGGGVLWDCTPLVTDTAVAEIKALGGLRAIAISHRHFYSSMFDWSEAFGGVPIHLHEDNRQYVMRPSERIAYWLGETLDLGQGVTLRRSGGHFVGSSVLHWAAGAVGKGVLMTGDTITVVPDTRWVSFMYSYPNLIPLPAREVRRIAGTVAPLAFDRIYSAWWDRVLRQDAKARLAASVERYLAAMAE